MNPSQTPRNRVSTTVAHRQPIGAHPARRLDLWEPVAFAVCLPVIFWIAVHRWRARMGYRQVRLTR